MSYIGWLNTPQTLKIEGYIKSKKVKMFIDLSSTHKLINYKLEKLLNFFVYLAPLLQLMIADEGTITFLRKCHSIKLSMV